MLYLNVKIKLSYHILIRFCADGFWDNLPLNSFRLVVWFAIVNFDDRLFQATKSFIIH